MKILVCGSEGSLMQAVIPKLLADKHTVIGVDNLLRYGKRLNLADDYIFIRTDLTDMWQVNRIVELHRPDMIIQAAARIYGVGGFNKYCADILGMDVSLHNNVIRAAVQYDVKKLVYISSSMVYENCLQNPKIAVSENMPVNYPAPFTDYGLSKFVGERLTVAAHKQYGLDYTIWRPFNIITPYEKSEGELGTSHVFADYINNILIKKLNPLPIIGDGEQIRCFTWIDEVAEAIAKFSFDDASTNDVFNIGNPEPISMKDLARLIHKKGVEKNILTSNDLEFIMAKEYENDVKVRIPSIVKTLETFAWQPKQSVEKSIELCVNHLLENKA